MKPFRRIAALLLAAGLLYSASAVGFAEASEKEEVVYIMTDAAGNVTSVNVVNIFSGGDIVDYGNYIAVKNLTTTDAITQNGDEISLSAEAELVYYQGTLEGAEIPWDISLRYFLDGTEYAPEELAGESGHLEIAFTVTENAACQGDYYQQYALQVSFNLSTLCCKNITAEDATMANSGSDKQLTFTILPGQGLDAVISADVTEFEMEAVTMNGVQLNLNVELDDEALMEQVERLMDAIAQLTDGSAQLTDGSAQLTDGSAALETGLDSLSGGAADLDGGVASVQAGLSTMETGLEELTGQSGSLTEGSAALFEALSQLQSQLNQAQASADELEQLTEASGAIQTGLAELVSALDSLRQSVGFAQYKALMAENGLDIDSLTQGNAQAVEALTQQCAALEQTLAQIQGVSGYESQAAELAEEIASLQTLIQLLSANSAAIGGMESYLDGVSAGIEQVYAGAVTLQASYAEFDAAVGELAGVLTDMVFSLSQLAGGVEQLAAACAELGDGVAAYTDGVAQLAAGFTVLTDGVSALAEGSGKLRSGARQLAESGEELYQGAAELQEGAQSLDDAISQLYGETSTLDMRVQEQIDELLSSLSGGEGECVSFVSEKNTNVTSVQFVLKTAAIEQAEEETPEDSGEEQLTFWQKLLRLFGLYYTES
ncbi:MAG: hypothetical protein LUE91_02920 [Oscillospiraceae bacterium]|nr:hypothetical protein [Oscillospiraceae bacterium]